MSPGSLRGVFNAGSHVPISRLEGQFRGVSLGLWGWVESLAWKTFVKCFHRDPAGGEIRGWNMRIHQDGLEAPVRPMLRGGEPIIFGHYVVVEVEGGVVLDYGLGRNPWYDPGQLVRDPLVALDAEGDRLLGFTTVAVGSWRVPTPSYFMLERGEIAG